MDSLSTAPVESEFRGNFSDIVDRWHAGLSTAASTLFNDPDALLSVIDLGKTFAAEVVIDYVPAAEVMQKTMFATLLSGVWSTGVNPSIPVIITAEGVPQDGEGCEGLKPKKLDLPGSKGSATTTVLASQDASEEEYLAGFVCNTATNSGFCKLQNLLEAPEMQVLTW